MLAAAVRTEVSYWGVSATPLATEAFIEALGAHQITYAHAAVTFTVNASGANLICFARPQHFGPTIFSVGGFVGGFVLFASGISVTNTLGIVLPYNLYTSVTPGLGLTTVTASSAP